MVILKVENSDFLRFVINFKGQSIIGSYMKAPTFVAQLMRFPELQIPAFIAVAQADQKGDLNPQLWHNPRIEF